MTITTSNESILEEHAEELAAIRQQQSLAAAVEAANRLIDLQEGEVAADGWLLSAAADRWRRAAGAVREKQSSAAKPWATVVKARSSI
jgi:hypothetical protein